MAEEFAVLSSPFHSADQRKRQEEGDGSYDYVLHKMAHYPLAVSVLLHTVPSTHATTKTVGKPVRRRGFVRLQADTARRPLEVFMILENGKLKLFHPKGGAETAKYSDGEKFPADKLKKGEIFSLQRVYWIEYPSLESSKFSITFEVQEQEQRESIKKNLMKTFSRKKSRNGSRTMSYKDMSLSSHGPATPSGQLSRVKAQRKKEQTMRGSRGSRYLKFPSLQKKFTAKKHKTVKEKDVEESQKAMAKQDFQDNLTFDKASKGSKLSTVQGDDASSKHTWGKATRDRDRSSFRSHTSRSYGSMSMMMHLKVAGTSDSSFMSVGSRDGSVKNLDPTSEAMLSKKTKGKDMIKRDQFGSPVDVAYKTYEFGFESVSTCQDWLRRILLDVENQSKLLRRYGEIGQNTNIPPVTVDLTLRKGLDLATLAKGHRNVDVWTYRRQFAEHLEEIGNYSEAKMWYDLSCGLTVTPNLIEIIEEIYRLKGRHPDFKAFKTMDEARSKLREFLESYGRGDVVFNSSQITKEMINDYDLYKVARRLEAEFARVPENFEFYLAREGKSALETIRDSVPEFVEAFVAEAEQDDLEEENAEDDI